MRRRSAFVCTTHHVVGLNRLMGLKQVLPSTLSSGDDGTLPVWPAGVSDPMMAALPSGRLLVARIKHKEWPRVCPARFHCVLHGGCAAQQPCAQCGRSCTPGHLRSPPGFRCSAGDAHSYGLFLVWLKCLRVISVSVPHTAHWLRAAATYHITRTMACALGLVAPRSSRQTMTWSCQTKTHGGAQPQVAFSFGTACHGR